MGHRYSTGRPFRIQLRALAYLKDHFRLVILSNVDNASFAFSNMRLGVDFDAIYTAEDVGSYKPSDRNFDYMLDGLAAQGLPEPISCIPQKACSTTMRRPIVTACIIAGSVAVMTSRVLARRATPGHASL